MTRCPRCHQRLRASGCPEHGPPTRIETAPLPPVPPAVLARWPQGACVAAGGSAMVFAVEDEAPAVVKWARWRDAAARRRFRHEAAMLTRAGAPVVPALLDAGDHDGRPYLVLERLVGPTLAAHIAASAPERIAAEATALVGALAAAVARLHERGVIHADLKPENVVGSAEGGMRLLDLGLAAAIDDAPGESEPGAGTPHYLAPEQLHGRALSPATDVYALGAIAFELLAGRPPFVGERPAIEYGHTMCRPPRLGQLVGVAPALETLVTACLAKEPADRPTVAALTAELARVDPAARATAPVAAARRGERGPAALVWITGADRAQVARAMTAAAGRILRERAEGTLVAFLWHDHDHPVRAAAAAVQRVDRAATIIVHSGDVQVRRSGNRIAVHGELIDHLDRWCPAVPCSGVLFTAAAAGFVGTDVVDADSAPGFCRLVERDRPARSQIATVPELVARHGLVEDARAVVDAALAGDGPCLVTVLGGGGSGKSRTLDELRRALAVRGVRVIDLAGRTGVAGRPTVAPALAAAVADLPGLTTLDRLRAAAERGAAVLADDAHRIEDEVLDVLETMSAWARCRLAIVVAADPSLVEARPRWGAGAARDERFVLRPLADAAAHALLRRQLAPARRIPDALIGRLAARAAGNPGALVAIAREIHRRGLVRRLPGGDEFHIAADELDFVSLEPDRRWRGARQLAALPAGMPALMQLCAALGSGFDLDELEATARVLPAAETTIDPAAGGAWLTRHGLLAGDSRRWTLADAAVAEAALDQLDPALRRAIHAAGLTHCLGLPGRDEAERLGRIAHHARGAGAAVEAAGAFLRLARLARRAHSYVEAERMATLALDSLGVDAPSDVAPLEPPSPRAAAHLAAQALAERARARRPMALYELACADLQRARPLAAAAADRALEIETLVDEGAIYDFTDRLCDSAATIEHAAALADAGSTPAATRARVDNWLGVVRARQGRLDDAAALLERAIAAAEHLDDHETAVGAMLMLGGVLRRAGRLDDARVLLDRAIARSEKRGDVFHVTVGLFNRINVWRMLGAAAPAAADCARAIDIAERHGYGQMEIAGWLNLSEVNLAAGHDADALEAARRGFDAARRRFGRRPPVVATTWLALLEAGHHHLDDARRLLDEIDPAEAASSPLLALRRRAVVTATGGGGPTLDALLADTAQLEDADRMSFTWLASRLASPPVGVALL